MTHEEYGSFHKSLLYDWDGWSVKVVAAGLVAADGSRMYFLEDLLDCTFITTAVSRLVRFSVLWVTLVSLPLMSCLS